MRRHGKFTFTPSVIVPGGAASRHTDTEGSQRAELCGGRCDSGRANEAAAVEASAFGHEFPSICVGRRVFVTVRSLHIRRPTHLVQRGVDAPMILATPSPAGTIRLLCRAGLRGPFSDPAAWQAQDCAPTLTPGGAQYSALSRGGVGVGFGAGVGNGQALRALRIGAPGVLFPPAPAPHRDVFETFVLVGATPAS